MKEFFLLTYRTIKSAAKRYFELPSALHRRVEVGASKADLGITDQFSFLERCLQEHVCPTCGGPLAMKSYNVERCDQCKFEHFNANPERTPHATE